MRAMSGRAIAIWTVAFALLILDVFISTYNLEKLIANDRAVYQARDISRALADVAATVTEAETGQRGYQITGRPEYLEPFREAESVLPGQLDHLQRLTAGDPGLREGVLRLTGLVSDRMARLRRVIELHDARGRDAARAVMVEGHGKRTMDEIRRLTEDLQGRVEEVAEQRSAAARDKYRSSTFIALFGGLLTILMVATAFTVVRRELGRRQQAEDEARLAAESLARSQRETTESLALLDAFLANAPIGIAFFDPDLRYRRVNEHLAEANGRPAADHLGRTIPEAVPQMPDTVLTDLREVAATHRPLLNREVTGRPGRPDRVWLTSYFPVATTDGRFLGVGVVAQDVTERLAAVQRLRDSEDRKTAMLETALDCIISVDDGGRVIEFNPAAERTFGYPRSEVVGRPLADLIVPTTLPIGHRDELTRFLATGDGPLLNRRIELAARRKDGTEFPAELAITAITAAERPIFTAFLRDITERRQAEDALRQSLDRFRSLVEAVPQMVFVADPTGVMASANGRWVEQTGQSPRESGDWTAAAHPQDAAAARSAWRAAVASPTDRFTYECRVRSGPDEYRWMLVTAVPLRAAHGAVVQWVATLTDIDDQKRQREILTALVRMRTTELESTNQLLRDEIAERRQAEDRARASAVELGRSNEELEKFAYVASHDLQEPLRKIQAFGDRLARKFRDVLGPDGQEYVDRMKASATRMRTLIDDLLTFSRVTTKAQPITTADLNVVVRDVLSDLETRLAQTGGTVDVGELPTLRADAFQMRQLFQNLIGNALKFQKPGVPPAVTIRATPWAALPDGVGPPPPAGTGYRISVADNGIGFDPAYADRVFEVFQRLHGRGEYEGTGIGLAICRKIVQRHGGDIVARSREGHGATFIIDLPAAAG